MHTSRRRTTRHHSFLERFLALSLGLTVVGLSPVGSPSAQAQLTWDNAGPTNDWSTAAGNENWIPAGGPPNTVWLNTQDAVFGAVTETVTPTTVNIVDDITFAGSWTIANGGAASIDLTTDGNSDITVDPTFTTSIAEVLSGTNAVTKLGAGTLTLSGANTYSGGTSINAGVLSVGNVSANGNLGATASSVTLNGGTLRLTNGAVATFGARVLNVGPSGGTLLGNGTATTGLNSRAIFNTANTLTGSGALALQGNGALDGFGGARGVVVVSAAQSYSGAITLSNGGLLAIEGGGLGSGATIALGTQSELSIGTGITVNNNVTVNSATASNLSWTNGGTGNLAGTLTLNANLTVAMRNWFNAAAQNGTISGAVSGVGGLAIAGGGNLTLSGTNSYSGATTISAGITSITGSNSGGGSYSLAGAGATLTLGATAGTVVTSGITTTASSNSRVLNLNGGVLQTTGNVFAAAAFGVVNLNGGTIRNGNSVSTAITVFANGLPPVASNTAGPTNVLAGGGTADTTGGNITFNLGLNGTAGGALTFTGGNTVFSGVTNTGLQTVSGTTTWDLNNLASSVAGLSGSGTITNSGAADRLLTITGSTSNSFSGSISPATTSRIALTVNKAGGVQTLSGTNAYTGATTINAGTLLVNGSLADTTVSVSAAGTLGGSGTIAGAVTVAGNLAPGNSPGILTVTNAAGTSFANGSTLTLELNGTTVGTDYDQLATNGVSIDANSNLVLSVGYGGNVNDTFTVINNTSANPFGGTGAFTNLTEGGTINSGAFTFTGTYLGGDGNDLVLTMTAVPEPSTFAMLLGGFGMLLGFQRSRRRA